VSLETKKVVVLSDRLSAGEAVNAAGVLGLSAGATTADLGEEGVDASGLRYGRLDRHPVPVLVAGQDQLRDLHERLTSVEGVHVVAFTEVARRSRDYEVYLAALAQALPVNNSYVGLFILGPRHRVTAATKRLTLFGAVPAELAAGVQ